MTTIVSIRTVGSPSVGLITLTMMLTSVGLPMKEIALIMGFDRELDILRTDVNVTGESVCALFVSKQSDNLAPRCLRTLDRLK